jgi:hypothetical protein
MFPILPKLISLGEFKPTGADLFEYEWMVTVMSRGQYHLLASVDPQGKNGIALLVHQDMTPRGPPTFQVLLHAPSNAKSMPTLPFPLSPLLRCTGVACVQTGSS